MVPTLPIPTSSLYLQRLITIPLIFVALSLCLSTGPFLLLVTLGVDLVLQRRFALSRGLAFLMCVVVGECVGVSLATLLWVRWKLTGQSDDAYLRANFDLQTGWTSALLGVVRVLYQMNLTVTGAEVLKPGPYLVFIRHASIADTMIPGAVLSRTTGIRLRYVLKRELLWDPCLNIVGCRLPNYFVDRDSREGEKEIEAIRQLGRGLDDDEGVLIYPEGTRYTPTKFARALERMAQSHPELVDKARQLRQILPPRLGGPVALLESQPPLDVVFCAHVGFEGATSLAEIASGSLIGRVIQVKFWRVKAAEIPVEAGARVSWLYDEWSKVDEQVCRWLDLIPEGQAP